jgi:hypothetical protein
VLESADCVHELGEKLVVLGENWIDVLKVGDVLKQCNDAIMTNY